MVGALADGECEEGPVMRTAWRWGAPVCAIGVALLWILWLPTPFRLLALPLLGATLALIVIHLVWRGRPWWWVAWMLTLGASFLPIDITLANSPGPPRFVPLVMGLPTQASIERNRRGEIALGGCMVSGQEPRWVLVW